MGNLVIGGPASAQAERAGPVYVDLDVSAKPAYSGAAFASAPDWDAFYRFLRTEDESLEPICADGDSYRKILLVLKSAEAAKAAYDEWASRSKYRLAKLTDVKAVQNALHQCFSWIPGERVLLPEFGSKLQLLLYEGITPATEEKIVAEVRHCVSEWEPRVEIEQVVNASTVEDTENNTIRLQVVYHIKGLDGRSFAYEHLYSRSQG